MKILFTYSKSLSTISPVNLNDCRLESTSKRVKK